MWQAIFPSGDCFNGGSAAEARRLAYYVDFIPKDAKPADCRLSSRQSSG